MPIPIGTRTPAITELIAGITMNGRDSRFRGGLQRAGEGPRRFPRRGLSTLDHIKGAVNFLDAFSRSGLLFGVSHDPEQVRDALANDASS